MNQPFPPGFNWRLAILMILAAVFSAGSTPAAAASHHPAAPTLSSPGAVLLDMQTGTVLYQKHPNTARPMASVTKIMTALITIEQTQPDETVVIPEAVLGVDGSRQYFSPGNTYTVDQLLKALMLGSANDAAVALAIHVSGSMEGFVNLMNQRAASLGLEQTHFSNPHGLDAPDHRTSPLDLALLSLTAMKHPNFRQLVSLTSATIPHPDPGVDRELRNHNDLLFNFDGATGIKNGYTSRAKHTLVGSAKRGEREVLAVILGAESQEKLYGEMAALLNYGLEKFTNRKVIGAGAAFQLPGTVVTGGGWEDSTLPVRTTTALWMTHPIDAPASDIQTEPAPFQETFQPPMQAGDIIGQLNIYENEALIATVPLSLAVNIRPAVTSGDYLNQAQAYVKAFFQSGPRWIWFVISVPVILFLTRAILHWRRRRVYNNGYQKLKKLGENEQSGLGG